MLASHRRENSSLNFAFQKRIDYPRSYIKALLVNSERAFYFLGKGRGKC
jgi:hypothetical protein